jgi:glucose-6-phosphate isomerase
MAALGARRLCMREPFAEDRRRGERLSAESAGLHLDCSRNRVTDETTRPLLRFTKEYAAAERIDAMSSGAKISVIEQRAARR